MTIDGGSSGDGSGRNGQCCGSRGLGPDFMLLLLLLLRGRRILNGIGSLGRDDVLAPRRRRWTVSANVGMTRSAATATDTGPTASIQHDIGITSRPGQDVDNGQEDTDAHAHGHSFLNQVIFLGILLIRKSGGSFPLVLGRDG